DDDPSARESLCWLLKTEGYNTMAFASADEFLEHWSCELRGCITVDIRMPRKSGIQLQEELNTRHNIMPIIVLTGHADVPVAIRAMKQGAYDFLEKPYSDHELLSSIGSAIETGREINRTQKKLNRASNIFDNLTEREREVMHLVVEGHTNKSVAGLLGISEKTVEVHRSRVMGKTATGSLSKLVGFYLLVKDRFE
ncbi:MAG: response regulator transcription factor, partial [Gammaproteobacteria bacterium]|nr:response regulator transcription factor [Gammaproteobacteria bacterium]